VGEVLEVVRELKAEGMTMLRATHEMGFARDVADEICFLHDGRIVERGNPEELLSQPRQPGDTALPAPAARRRTPAAGP
jgi:polar amino acid transport system ATP-binding protein